MSEDNKKISLLSQLDNIIDNNGVNNNIYEYTFTDVNIVVLNQVHHNVQGRKVHIVLYFDEILIEIYKDDKLCSSYSLPYIFVDNFHLIGGSL